MPKNLLRVGALVLGTVVMLSLFERNLIFFPTAYPAGDWAPAGLAPEDVWFESPDGVRLHGWYLAAESPRAVVLFAGGNGGNLSDRAEFLRVLHRDLGLTVMIFDYRGYGRSEGSPSVDGVFRDARAARAWLAEREGMLPEDLVLLGRSLGGGIMVDIAAREGARALVLESTFSSLAEVGRHHYPYLPVRLILRGRFDSSAIIGDYDGPLLQSHGDRDEMIPRELGRRLFEAAGEPKRFVDLPGGRHNDFPPPAYYEALDEFLDGLES